ncbi:dihydrofolate reductase [Sediminibacterium roseum]|uniref:Dihydrofolate reductase n=1 Tax=Sediminibacterium roseum TaxID=1978412 RepID=A0ABW9ZVR2_9BACT|nr:dihydrofolate reductase [Sediminibacterium roseum]NCI51257.1 dihydrofolate reductase [Sediminibacterium roseum]
MVVSLIVAASTNHVIGKNNQLLWSLPNDMKFFKNTTWAMPVLMGRKTFESLGKPLPGRLNIVITRQQGLQLPGATVVHSLDEALKAAAAADYKESFVIGGGEIFKEAMETADKIYLTRVDAVLDGDAFFPELDPSKWKMVSNQSHPADAKHKYAYHFQLWARNNS